MAKIRKKKCIICKESFVPIYTSLQKTCSVKCAIEASKIKESKKISSLNEMRNEKFSIEKLNAVLDQTKLIVHDYIRERDKGKPCISCGSQWKNDFQACHRFNVKQFNGIRFDLMNIHGGCVGCNIYLDGNYDAYDLRLPNRIGEEEYQKLHKRAKIAFKIPHTFTRTELKEIQKQVKLLKKQL